MRPPADTRAELLRALGVLAEPPGPAHRRLADLLGLAPATPAEWTEAFVVQLVPHASIYLGTEGMLGGEAADRVAGFWRALRMPVPADPDHLTALLGLYSSIVDAEVAAPAGPARVLRRQARTALLHEHLLSWLPGYTHAMVDVGPPGYAAWARLLREALHREVAEVGVPDRLPAQLREVPALDARCERIDDLLDGLFSPARCGLVLARGHLAGLARDSGLGLRLGDRRRILRTLLEQDPPRVLSGLAGLARRWAARHRADEPVTGPAATLLADRAATTARLLDTAAARPLDTAAVPPEPRYAATAVGKENDG